MTVRQLDITSNENYRPQLRRVKLSEDKNVIISCSIEALPEILKQAQQVGLLSDKHQFIITSLDMHTIDLEPFQHSGANITGVRLVVPEDSNVRQVTEFFAEKYNEKLKREKGKNSKENGDDSNDDDDDDTKDDDDNDEDKVPPGLTAENIRVDTALTFDAVLLFSEVVRLEGGVRVKNIKCDDDSGLRLHGISDSNSMKTIPPIRGLTGDIHFDTKGRRSNYQVEVIELATDGIRKIGNWNTTDGLYLARAHPISDSSELSLRNKTFVVLTALVSFKVSWNFFNFL